MGADFPRIPTCKIREMGYNHFKDTYYLNWKNQANQSNLHAGMAISPLPMGIKGGDRKMKKRLVVTLTCLAVLAVPVPAFAATTCPVSGCAAGQCFSDGYCGENCFTDENGDGICDNHCYADTDGNGICDYFVDGNEDGICDHCHDHGKPAATYNQSGRRSGHHGRRHGGHHGGHC